jgi:hypothetical protein
MNFRRDTLGDPIAVQPGRGTRPTVAPLMDRRGVCAMYDVWSPVYDVW